MRADDEPNDSPRRRANRARPASSLWRRLSPGAKAGIMATVAFLLFVIVAGIGTAAYFALRKNKELADSGETGRPEPQVAAPQIARATKEPCVVGHVRLDIVHVDRSVQRDGTYLALF